MRYPVDRVQQSAALSDVLDLTTQLSDWLVGLPVSYMGRLAVISCSDADSEAIFEADGIDLSSAVRGGVSYSYLAKRTMLGGD